MDDWKKKLEQVWEQEIHSISLSGPKEVQGFQKVQIRPITLRGQLCYQASCHQQAKVLHQNYSKEELFDYVMSTMLQFRQTEIQMSEEKIIILVSKKGKVTVLQKKGELNSCNQEMSLSHNRKKQYILQEGVAYPFMVDLGVMTKEGQIISSRYDKYRQINRYLEMVEDILPALPTERNLEIVDFGCGKSYLTFALYYFLHTIHGLQVTITGLDLKKDVIEHCNQLASKYGYCNLQFVHGDISKYSSLRPIDMVISLHACDTATDYALYQAILWKAKVILSVPCCQHELAAQMDCPSLMPVMKYGYLREKMASLMTDGIRANLLEVRGYDTQILEFIDMEHTPKNLLIRATRKDSSLPEDKRRAKLQEVEELCSMLGVDPMLKKLLAQTKTILR